jgi:hypothetical protein
LKISTRARIGLIAGIILFSLLVVPVSASDDASWFQPAPLDDIMAWFKSTTQNVWTVPSVPADSSLIFPETTPSYEPSDDTTWFQPASPEQAIAWGKRLSEQTTYLSTLSQEDRIRLNKPYYNPSGYIPTFPTVTPTSAPVTQPVQTYVYPTITKPPTPYYVPSTMPTAFPTQASITVPPTPYYIPSTMPTAYPTISPTSDVVAPGQNSGVSLSELNLPGKYVRITNTGSTPVVMTGWKITNNQGNALTFIDFPLGGGTTFTYVLNPYSTLIVYFGKEGMVSANELYYPYGVDFWNQQGDTVSLYDPKGQLAGRITV